MAFSCVALAQAPPQPKMDCAADGVVVNAMTGEPIARAHVSAQPGTSNAVADATGHWTLANVACGRVQIFANKTGFIASTAPSESPAHEVKIALTPQSVATGKVVDEYGDPIPQVRVTVMISRVLQGRRSFQSAGIAMTNDLGEFRVASLQAGRYIVCAIPALMGPPNGSTAYSETCYPGPPEGGAASAMDLPAGRETQVNFTLHETAVYKVHGTATNAPKAGSIAVSLQSRAQSGIGGMPAPAHSTTIRPDGTFTITGVPPGTYTMACDYWEEGGRLTARVPVSVGSSDVEGVVIHLEPAFRLSGTVRVESAGGNAMPKRPWPLNLRSQDPNGGGAQVTWSSDLLSFSVTEAPVGNYRVEGNPPPPFYVKSAVLDGRDLTREAVPIARSGGRLDLVVSDESGSIEGGVEDSDGQVVGGVPVMAMQEGRAPRNVVAGADGRFRISGLPPGDYSVYAWNDLQLVEYADSEWMNQHARGQKVSVSAGSTASVKVVEQIVK